MKSKRLIVLLVSLFNLTTCLFAQEKDTLSNATTYRIKAFGSAATGSQTPFWMVSNQYGVIPLDAGNGYLRAGAFHHQQFGKGFHWEAGLELVGAIPRYKNVYIQQIYAEIGYKCLLLNVGSKERYRSLWDKNLSSGDIIESPNARPIPEINISIPEFTIVPKTKGWLSIKGNFAVGRSFDTDYLEHFSNGKQTYTQKVLWHHKSFYLRIADTKNDFPLSATVGVQHRAQWGGTSSNPNIGVQPHSIKDFIRVVCGKEGGSDATTSDQINVLGNHLGSYDFKLSYTQKNWAAHAYHQHYFEDKSGMDFYNKTDGLWGIQIDLPHFQWIRKVVAEYFITKDQSGSFHFIEFDHDIHPGRGGGGDDYYNNGEYSTGYSYFNRAIGSPLIPSPEYNQDGSLGFLNNRVKDLHLGLEGDLSPLVSYRLLFTTMNSWGRHSTPFLAKKSGNSGAIDITYHHPKLEGWIFKGSIAADTGNMFGKNIGFALSVSKRGIIKKWK